MVMIIKTRFIPNRMDGRPKHDAWIKGLKESTLTSGQSEAAAIGHLIMKHGGSLGITIKKIPFKQS